MNKTTGKATYCYNIGIFISFSIDFSDYDKRLENEEYADDFFYSLRLFINEELEKVTNGRVWDYNFSYNIIDCVTNFTYKCKDIESLTAIRNIIKSDIINEIVESFCINYRFVDINSIEFHDF